MGALSLASWLRQHQASVVEAWVNFSADRAANLVSILVISVTFAMPLLLHVAHHNVTAVLGQLGSSSQATLFMDRDATLEEANKLANRLRSDQRLGEITLIDKASALAEFSEISGLQTAIGSLPTNPLPHSLVILGTEIEGNFRTSVTLRCSFYVHSRPWDCTDHSEHD